MKPIFCLAILLMLNGCNTPAAREEKPLQNIAASGVQAAQKPDTPARYVVFDVPALLNKKIDQIKAELGKPSEEDTPNLNEEEMETRYAKEGYHMVITYTQQNQQVESILLAAAAGKTRDCGKLLQIGNLQAGDPRYLVDSLNRDEQGYYLGIVITRK